MHPHRRHLVLGASREAIEHRADQAVGPGRRTVEAQERRVGGGQLQLVEVVDEGRVELTPADWEATQQGTECCRTHLQVDRVVDGVVAPEFGAGGSLEGIQRRSLDRYTFPFPGGSIEGC
jgi:hypothetical protein